MGQLLKNIHWAIILYTLYNAYILFDEKNAALENVSSQITPVESELKTNVKSLKEIENYYKNITEEKLKIEKVALEIEKTQQLLPSEITDTENIQTLKKWAEDLNIKEISISPDQEKEKEFLVTRAYKVKVKATFIQLLILLEKVAEYKRIMNVGQIAYDRGTEMQRGRFQIITADLVIEVYRYNQNYKEDRGYEKIEENFKAKGSGGKS